MQIRRTGISLYFAAVAFCLSAAPSIAKPCLEVWNDYKNWPLAVGQHKVMATVKGMPTPITCWWWRSNSVEESTKNALAKCNQWEADSCEIIDVDGVPKRAGLDQFFARPHISPVDIDVFDGPTQKHQQLTGTWVSEQPVSGPSFHFRLLAQGRAICEGDYTHEFMSMSITGTAKCFGEFEFSSGVSATGYRYVDGRKVGYAYDIMFKKDESYIHVVSKP